MFNGVGEQIQQFIAAAAAAAATSTTAIPLHLPLSLPLHVSPTIFAGFNSPVIDASPHPVLPGSHHFLHGLPVQDNDSGQEEKVQEEDESSCRSIDLERDRSVSADPKGRWLEEESLGVMRARSGIEGGFHDSVISRKFAEAGFNRNNTTEDHYTEITNMGGGVNMSKYSKKLDGGKEQAVGGKLLQGETRLVGGLNLEEYSGDETPENASMEINTNPAAATKELTNTIIATTKKRKRSSGQNLEKMKGMCEAIVQDLMARQEVLHRRLLEDLENREAERVAREEALRMQEIARIDSEIEIRAREQALACTRDAAIINLLKKFTSDEHEYQYGNVDEDPSAARVVQILKDATAAAITTTKRTVPTSSPTSVVIPSLPFPTTETPTSCKPRPTSSHPDNSTNTTSAVPRRSSTSSTTTNDLGRRWPKAEVYTLINLRCSIFKTTEDKTGKVSLWERISQKMTEMGYNRSAKRCKEKWENINKYFKKTKDAARRRSSDSKTCPYFHELSRLYEQGVLLLHQDAPEKNRSDSPENPTESTPSSQQLGGGGGGYHEDTVLHAGENDSDAVFRVVY